ncbi:MAG: rRNA maturation RNase YbeY [Bdellovibrionales bacterium]|nr:rRNA maturation RNase YbeY [Bdellovibrionales bacterium]
MVSKPVALKEIETYALTAVQKWLKRVLKEPKVRARLVKCEADAYQVDLSVCGSSKMSHLNSTFRKKTKPTDVLSFPTPELFQRQGLLGDLVLCGPVAVKQAKEQRHTWKREVDVLIVHGLLHLCHFDHEDSPKEAELMADLESRVLGSGKRAGKSKGLVKRASQTRHLNK